MLPLPPPIDSPRALLTLAEALEHQAALRYRDLAERMRQAQEPELHALFEFLAGLEARHGEQIARRASGPASGDGLQPSARAVCEVPENFDEEAARSAKLNPYTALAIAVRNEERAFAFYCYVAAAAVPADIQLIAEDLARDELRHASLLRHARRAAYRRENRHVVRPADIVALPQTTMALRVLADEWRSDAAGHHHALAAALDRDGQQVLASAFRQVASEEVGDAPSAPDAVPTDTVPADAAGIRLGIRRLEVLFDRFDDIATTTHDPAIVVEAQALAETCVRWLALVGGVWRNEMLSRAPDRDG